MNRTHLHSEAYNRIGKRFAGTYKAVVFLLSRHHRQLMKEMLRPGVVCFPNHKMIVDKVRYPAMGTPDE